MTPRQVLKAAEDEIARANRWLEVAFVARQLGVSGQTVRNWINADRVVALRTPTGRYKIAASELARLLKSSQDPQYLQR